MLRLFFILLLSTLTLWAGRCQKYIQLERVAHYAVFGVDYPYWYGVGQLKQESGCRDIISRDGVCSQGVAQITYRVWQKFLNKKGIKNLYSVGNQIHAQAYIMKNCKKQAYSSHLWVAYSVYNSGHIVNKEITKARKALHIREVPWNIARKFCKRRMIHFNNGQTISACKIGYDYPKKVFKYGQKYKEFNTTYRFW